MGELFLEFIKYFASGLGLLVLGTILFEVTTKNKEFQLIFSGNKAAVYALGGRILGLAIVIQAAITNSIDVVDMIEWGAFSIVVQILSFYLVEWLTPKFDVKKAIDEDNGAVGLLLLVISVSVGLLISGCLTY